MSPQAQALKGPQEGAGWPCGMGQSHAPSQALGMVPLDILRP